MNKYQLHQAEDRAWHKGKALVVAGEENDWQAILNAYHDILTTRHLRVAKMLQAVVQDYWWPSIHDFV